ncbi:hypothetical protein J0X14_14355 [Muricauda sp. CAU 1633]|uniref:hypothetical protein n=1 Tax=Allomuricauda sp. CAU 1633 TaxID=2816036 RepID=UPI001A8D1D0E|nr:hypothetical protein [Muricauda sp. CAU 1633]MBO0323487.1 hypothetical protein [Muricauda sp. CAU 1633]
MYGEIKKEELSACREISLGEQIFNMLDGLSPKDKRMALKEAEERVHQSFDKRMGELKKEAELTESQWNEFKNS